MDDLESYSAVVLAGGRAERLGGFDKASAEIGGRTLLADLDLAEVPAVDEEHRDVDTWADLRDLRES